MYRASSADLFRIATQGTGTLPEGDIHPDLTKRLAVEASTAAQRVLRTCIRAIDYCPPVDITFGDFLRGIVTADLDFSPGDKGGGRIVFIESFRDWGIYPRGVTSMGIDALAWPRGAQLFADLPAHQKPPVDEQDLAKHLKKFVVSAIQNWNLESNRYEVWKDLNRVRFDLWKWLHDGDSFGRAPSRRRSWPRRKAACSRPTPAHCRSRRQSPPPPGTSFSRGACSTTCSSTIRYLTSKGQPREPPPAVCAGARNRNARTSRWSRAVEDAFRWSWDARWSSPAGRKSSSFNAQLMIPRARRQARKARSRCGCSSAQWREVHSDGRPVGRYDVVPAAQVEPGPSRPERRVADSRPWDG